MKENFVQFMAKQVEAQTHEESKFWRASQPLPNQSSMQGRESEKKYYIQQFRMAMRNAKRSTSCRTESKSVKNVLGSLQYELIKSIQTKFNTLNHFHFHLLSIKFLETDFGFLSNTPCRQITTFNTTFKFLLTISLDLKN